MPDELDEVKQQVQHGKLVPLGPERDAFVSRMAVSTRPKIGDVLPGPVMVTSVDTKPTEGWRVKVRPLVPPRTGVGKRKPRADV